MIEMETTRTASVRSSDVFRIEQIADANRVELRDGRPIGRGRHERQVEASYAFAFYVRSVNSTAERDISSDVVVTRRVQPGMRLRRR